MPALPVPRRALQVLAAGNRIDDPSTRAAVFDLLTDADRAELLAYFEAAAAGDLAARLQFVEHLGFPWAAIEAAGRAAPAGSG